MMKTPFILRATLFSLTAIFVLTSFAGGQNLPTDDKINVAVLTLKNAEGVTAGDAEIISDRLRAELFNTGKVNIMERDQMLAVLKEQGFQQSGACTDEGCMVEIGKLLGVKQLVTGSIGKLGSVFLVNVRVIDVSTGKIIKVLSRDLNGMDVVVGHLPGISRELVGVDKAHGTSDTEQGKGATVQSGSAESAQKNTPGGNSTNATNDNKNRVGIHLGYNFYIGETWIYLRDNNKRNDTLNLEVHSVVRRPVQQPNLYLNLALGPFLTLDLGAGFAFWSEDLTGTRTGNLPPAGLYDSLAGRSGTPAADGPIDKLTFRYLSVPIMAGLNVFIRPYPRFPLKVTFGPMCSWDPTWIAVLAADSLGRSLNQGKPLVNAPATALTLGGKAGMEVFLGKHVGLGGDFLYRAAVVRPGFQLNGWKITGRTPYLGAGATMNYYF